MEANPASELPQVLKWQYEPKWDGFRCLTFRDGRKVDLKSKSQKSLSRYFPELGAALRALKAPKFVLDGGIVIAINGKLSFDNLLMRIHPAASRVQKLSTEEPSLYVVHYCDDLWAGLRSVRSGSNLYDPHSYRLFGLFILISFDCPALLQTCIVQREARLTIL